MISAMIKRGFYLHLSLLLLCSYQLSHAGLTENMCCIKAYNSAGQESTTFSVREPITFQTVEDEASAWVIKDYPPGSGYANVGWYFDDPNYPQMCSYRFDFEKFTYVFYVVLTNDPDVCSPAISRLWRDENDKFGDDMVKHTYNKPGTYEVYAHYWWAGTLITYADYYSRPYDDWPRIGWWKTTINVIEPDSDGDGMPDWWENQYNLDPLVDDSSLDPDLDSWTNLAEYIGQMDPTNFNFLWFSPSVLHPVTGWGNSYGVYGGDINNDGKSDIIWNATTASGNYTSVGISNGDGTFTFPPGTSHPVGGWSEYKTLIGDVSGDGKADIIWNATTTSGNYTSVGISNGDGTFIFPPGNTHPLAGWSAYKTLVGDVDGDGKTDIIWNATTASGNYTSVGISNGDGTFTFSPGNTHPLAGWSAYKTLVGDVNGDGKADIIWNATTTSGNYTSVGISNGDGTFTFSPGNTHPLAGWSTYKTLVGDVNGDGKADIIWNATTTSGNYTSVGISNGDGTFTFPPGNTHPLTGWNEYKTLVGDVNGDGKTDIIWNATTTSGNYTAVGISNGDGSFSFPLGTTHPLSGWNAYKTLIGDINGDGQSDLLWNATESDNWTSVGIMSPNIGM